MRRVAGINQPPEIWGGIECTINRIGDQQMDQCSLAKMEQHPEYLDAVMSLGIKKLRFPLLWEKHQPYKNVNADFESAEKALKKMQANNITPIVGLVHHGSGPMWTNLMQKDFPENLAAYASQVATRFPWLEYYTPVNEPLTTARFSGLYSHWYPHKKNEAAFIKMLLNELKATVLAMKAIRQINPEAKLVQTEDLAKTYSTKLLQYQAAFENHRRWLTFDILAGKVDEQHPLWNYFQRLGISYSQLFFFIENPCPPDIIGLNYYITSERFLDHHLQDYPAHSHGGNDIHQYADVEAARVNITSPHGPEILLKEVWERYQLPMALTEVHLQCTREDQLRWLKQMYDIATRLKQEGVNIQAVTSWALLGSFGWNKLLTQPGGPHVYETGAFDISCGYTRPTALAALIKDLVNAGPVSSEVLPGDGWWKRSERFFLRNENRIIEKIHPARPVVIIGSTGTLGNAFAKICAKRHLSHVLLGREEADITDTVKLQQMVEKYQPWAIINTAGFVNVDEAELNRHACTRINALGVKNLAVLCETNKIKLAGFSSDLVFNGSKGKGYVESDLAGPLNVYGQSKVMAEYFLSVHNPSALMIRTSAFFGPWDQHNFVTKTISALQNGEIVQAPYDLIVSPTYVPHLVNATLDLLIDNTIGIVHLANTGNITWYEFAKTVASAAGLDGSLIHPISSGSDNAKRPSFSALCSERVCLMPSLQTALTEYFEQTGISILQNKKLTSS